MKFFYILTFSISMFLIGYFLGHSRVNYGLSDNETFRICQAGFHECVNVLNSCNTEVENATGAVQECVEVLNAVRQGMRSGE
jgi:hypothetical protein